MFAFLQSTPLFAQLSTSVTDDRIRMIIVALLVVAALLAVITIWFFVHTSPRRRSTSVAVTPAGAHSTLRTGHSTESATAGSSAPSISSAVGATSADDAAHDDDDDEWLRLTSPEKRVSPAVDQNRPPVWETDENG